MNGSRWLKGAIRVVAKFAGGATVAQFGRGLTAQAICGATARTCAGNAGRTADLSADLVTVRQVGGADCGETRDDC